MKIKLSNKVLWTIFLTAFITICVTAINNTSSISKNFSRISNGRTYFEQNHINNILNNHQDNLVGIDISHYQGNINWEKLDSVENLKPVDFVFIRATYGASKIDSKFGINWENANNKSLTKGAYHYYRPNENSTMQAKNFIKNVSLAKGDFPPVLDIEKVSDIQSIKQLKDGILNWLTIIEKHYGVKPIIYTGEFYYSSYLSNKPFSDYTLWIANYNYCLTNERKNWHFWQFTTKGKVGGINDYVDVNIFKGTKDNLNEILIN